MKRTFILLYLLSVPILGIAQGNESPYYQSNTTRANPFRVIISHIIHAHSLITPGANVKRAKGYSIDNEDIMPRNNVSVGLSSLALNTLSLNYERAFYFRLTGIAQVSYTHNSQAISPVRNFVQDFYNSTENVQIEYPAVSRLSVLLGFRQYVRQNLKGWYFQPFAQYATNNVSLPIVVQNENGTNINDILSGKMNGRNVGISTGVHFDLKQKISIDLQLGGISFGQFKGNLLSKESAINYTTANKKDIADAYNEALSKTAINTYPDMLIANNRIIIGGNYHKFNLKLPSIRIGYRF